MATYQFLGEKHPKNDARSNEKMRQRNHSQGTSSFAWSRVLFHTRETKLNKEEEHTRMTGI